MMPHVPHVPHDYDDRHYSSAIPFPTPNRPTSQMPVGPAVIPQSYAFYCATQAYRHLTEEVA